MGTAGAEEFMATTYKGLYKRDPKSDRPSHVQVEDDEGNRLPLAIDEYEAADASPDWRDLPWESDFKKHAADQ
jgi:hypothetical protein